MKENYGNLNELKELGQYKKRAYTIEQIHDPNLKCKDGESMKEVQVRMEKSIFEILKKNCGKKVVVVSHGAAIKFFLIKWCKLNNDKLYYNKKEIKVNSPGIIKVKFLKNELHSIETIC